MDLHFPIQQDAKTWVAGQRTERRRRRQGDCEGMQWE